MQPRQTSALHLGRRSLPGVTYFVTACTRDRVNGLATAAGDLLCDLVMASDAEGDTETHAFTVMPDHIHWLFTLGRRLSLGRSMARLKAQSGYAMDAAGPEWQRDFFEHWLRSAERMEPYGRYVFLNPYRAGLIRSDERWPWWFCPKPEGFRFVSQLNAGGTPPCEWVNEAVPNGLAVGE